MSLEEKIMILSGCSDVGVISVYKQMAIEDVRVYLNRHFSETYILENYEGAVIRLIVKKIKGSSREGRIQSYTLGDKSVTYSSTIESDDEIKKMLPRPYIRLK